MHTGIGGDPSIQDFAKFEVTVNGEKMTKYTRLPRFRDGSSHL
jgi:hypothetical protein